MGFSDKFKNIFNVSEEEYFDDMDIDERDRRDDDYSKDVRSNSFGFNRSRNESGESKVVEMRSTAPAAPAAKAHVVFKKLDRYEDVGSVADVLNEKRIVILNLETCPNDVSVRVIDFLSGVAYANRGQIKKVANCTFIITPYHVDIMGDLMDELENCKDNAAVKEVGITWAIQQSKELIAAGIPCIHYYTMSKADATYKIAREVF